MADYNTHSTITIEVDHLVEAENENQVRQRIDEMVKDNLPQVFDAVRLVNVDTAVTTA